MDLLLRCEQRDTSDRPQPWLPDQRLEDLPPTAIIQSYQPVRFYSDNVSVHTMYLITIADELDRLYATKYKDLKTPLIVTFTVFLIV